MIYLYWSKSRYKRHEDDQRQIHRPTHELTRGRNQHKNKTRSSLPEGMNMCDQEVSGGTPCEASGLSSHRLRLEEEEQSSMHLHLASCLICEWCSSIKGTYTANDPLFIAPKPFFYSSELLEFGPGFETCRVGFERDGLHCSDRSQVRSHCRGNEREREGIVCTCIEPGRPGRPL